MAIQAYLTRGSRVLDVGCGCGREAVALEQQGIKVWALDLVPRHLRMAQVRLRSLGLAARCVCADAGEGIPFAGTFDGAVLLEQVYQHIPERETRLRCLAEVRSVLKPNGVLLLSAFNEGDIDLWARLRWMRETKWRLADGANLLDARFNAIDECGSGIPLERRSLQRRILWVLAYLRFLIRRRRRAREALRNRVTDETGCCKVQQRINPEEQSEGWFWFRVMSLGELEEELATAGYCVERVYPFLGDRYRCSQRGSRGAPLVLVAARPAEVSMNA
jgi:SAM-dependent methyltransferase